MKKSTTALLLSAAVLTALSVAPSFAADLSAGSNGNLEEASRALPGGVDFQFKSSKPMPGLTVDGDSRDLGLDQESQIKASGVLGRSSDGKDIRMDASDSVKKAIKGQIAGGDRGANVGDESVDPEVKTEDATRQVYGADDRIQVTNTKRAPYASIGYIEMQNKKGEFFGCSGTLIGPKTVLTAAHCLYKHEEEGGWLDKFLFVPGLAGPEDAPFGAYSYDSAYILQGYVDNYKGEYGSVIPWDLGIITLKEPIGDSLGWLAYYAYPDLGDFEANIAGYQGDKPPFTMWRTTCDVRTEAVYDDVFSYDCDTYQGSSGSAVYAYDSGAKARVIVGVNVASGPQIMNRAVRLNQANFEWINGLNK